jgi:hypothetical protein
MQSNSGTQCYHCGKLRLARCCPHCGYHEIAVGEIVVCQRCGGVFRHGRCFQCTWSGEPFPDVAHRDQDAVLGMGELDKMEQRLARRASALGVDPQLDGPVGDAVNHAFAQAHKARIRMPAWTPYFESVAAEYLEHLAEARGPSAPC